jgi:hypothetical protein
VFVDIVVDDVDAPLKPASVVPNNDAQCDDAPLPLPLAFVVLPLARCETVAGSTDAMESILTSITSFLHIGLKYQNGEHGLDALNIYFGLQGSPI